MPGLPGTGVGGHEQPEAGRVHEREPTQIEDDHLGPIALDALQLRLGTRGGGDVELALEDEADAVSRPIDADRKRLHRR